MPISLTGKLRVFFRNFIRPAAYRSTGGTWLSKSSRTQANDRRVAVVSQVRCWLAPERAFAMHGELLVAHNCISRCLVDGRRLSQSQIPRHQTLILLPLQTCESCAPE